MYHREAGEVGSAWATLGIARSQAAADESRCACHGLLSRLIASGGLSKSESSILCVVTQRIQKTEANGGTAQNKGKRRNTVTDQPPVKKHQQTRKFLNKVRKTLKNRVWNHSNQSRRPPDTGSEIWGPASHPSDSLLARRHGVPSQSHPGRQALHGGG
jgi:hypothetical protein